MDLPEQVPGAERSQFALLRVTRASCRSFSRSSSAPSTTTCSATRWWCRSPSARPPRPQRPACCRTSAQGLFILPFFLFSALAGQIADKYEKSRLIRQTRLAEVSLMFGAAAALYVGPCADAAGAHFPVGCARHHLWTTQVFAHAAAPAPERTGGRQRAGRRRHVHRDSHRHDLGRTAGAHVHDREGRRPSATSPANIAAAIAMVVVAVGT